MKTEDLNELADDLGIEPPRLFEILETDGFLDKDGRFTDDVLVSRFALENGTLTRRGLAYVTQLVLSQI